MIDDAAMHPPSVRAAFAPGRPPVASDSALATPDVAPLVVAQDARRADRQTSGAPPATNPRNSVCSCKGTLSYQSSGPREDFQEEFTATSTTMITSARATPSR